MRRRAETLSVYVFPADIGFGHITIPQKQINKIVKESGVSFTVS